MNFNMNNVKHGLVIARAALIKSSPYILTGIGACGVVSTAIFASKATLQATKIVHTEEGRRSIEPIVEGGAENFELSDFTLKKSEVVKLTWKCYIPTVAMSVISIGCIIGAQAINSRRQAALASLYSLSELALKEYQDKVTETFGEKGQQKIRDGLAKDAMEKDPVTSKEVIITGKGDTLCYDHYTGRYFKCDIEKLRQIQNDINEQILVTFGNEVTLNDFYYALGLEPVKSGYDIGWDTEHPCKLVFASQLAKDGTPCLVVDYDIYKVMNCPF